MKSFSMAIAELIWDIEFQTLTGDEIARRITLLSDYAHWPTPVGERVAFYLALDSQALSGSDIHNMLCQDLTEDLGDSLVLYLLDRERLRVPSRSYLEIITALVYFDFPITSQMRKTLNVLKCELTQSDEF